MMLVPAGIKVHMAVGYTDLRKGLDGLAVLIEQVLEKDPFSGHMFVFRGRRADMIKVLFWDGSGLCLLTKRLEKGRFAWPVADEYGLTVTMTAAQLSMLLEGTRLAKSGARVAASSRGIIKKNLRRLATSSWSGIASCVELFMRLDLANLPNDMTLLHQLVHDLAAGMEQRDGEIEKLRLIIRQLQRSQFGRRSERLDPDQLQFGLEELDADIARAEAKQPQPAPVDLSDAEPAKRRDLPEHLPREEMMLDVNASACPSCGSGLHPIGVTTSEMLDWVPASLRVIRIHRPKYGCRACGKLHQAPAPERLIAKGHGDARAGGTGACQQILRSHAALSPGADLCSPRHRSRSIDPRQLGWRRLLVAGSAP